VNVWFKDAAGNVSESVDASISLGVYDTTAPTAVSVVIDGGADNTTSSSVTLTLSATDDQAVTNYYASESAVTPQAGDSGWDNYSTSVSYSFDNDTAETKTVNVWFKDAAGNVSGSVADSISLIESPYLSNGPIDWHNSTAYSGVTAYAVDHGAPTKGSLSDYNSFCNSQGQSIIGQSYPSTGRAYADTNSTPYQAASNYFTNIMQPAMPAADYDNILVMHGNSLSCFAYNAEYGSMQAFGGPTGSGYAFCRNSWYGVSKRFHIYLCK
jgi:hypothetical protein